MIRTRLIQSLFCCCFLLSFLAHGQRQPDWEIESMSGTGGVVYDVDQGIATATNGVMVRYGMAVLTADRVAVHQETGEVLAEGKVRIQQGDQVWASDRISYNFKTRNMQSEHFRTGKAPVFAAGLGLGADTSNRVYTATNALITADDVARPFLKVRASYIRIIPGERVIARDATLYLGQVPIFWFPYYTRSLDPRANRLSVTPGYRSTFGAFALGTYSVFLNEHLDGALHVDYRTKRGFATGPELNYDYGRWGKGTFNYYYLRDEDPNASVPDLAIPEDRQRFLFSYSANPATNFQALSVVRWQSDLAVVRDFFESEYRRNPQPNTFVELNKFWDNFSLDLYYQPRLNDFLETVERLPEVRLSGWRQRLGETPLYYESESSLGYYQRSFAEDAGIYGPPPGLDYSATRADSFHQVLLPKTFFGWFNVTPRVGGRLTYYSEASGPGAVTDEQYRGVFNTGAEFSFKASRVWPGYQNALLEMEGARHIVQPMVNYVYVPEPTERPPELPQFDYEFPTLRLLPNEFPDYNAIDAIDSQNVTRLGVRNRLQTKREGRVVDVASWDLYTDLRLDPRDDQTDFSDLFSDLILRPRSWLTLESLLRYNVHEQEIALALNSFRIHPGNVWSWGLTHFYLRDDLRPVSTALGEGAHNVASTLFYRLNENWGFRTSQYYNIRDNRLDEQFYSIYRDLRSWTAALTFSWRTRSASEDDFGIAFTFSLKAFPRYNVGTDTVAPYTLLGSR